jgi:hypothetical protein
MKEKKWQWIIVADDAAWKLLMIRMGFDANEHIEYYGQTDIDHGITFIRGWTLTHPDRIEANPEHVIAHEMAHVYLHSRDEKLVDETAEQWLTKLAADKLAADKLAAPTVASR